MKQARLKNRREHLISFIKNFIHVRLRRKPTSNIEKILHEWHQPAEPAKSSDKPLVTWIGHSTFLIQIAGINIVTDPIFFPLSILFPRIVPPGISMDNLPVIDIVLISHDHRDHMEKQSMLQLAKHNPVVLAPRGLARRLTRWGFKKIVEHTWGDTYTVTTDKKQKVSCTFLPAAHWAGSNFFTINKSEHGSWMIEGTSIDISTTNTTKNSLYFAGDTSYDNHFKEISQQFSSIDGALLPIGPIEPRHLVEYAHIDARQALQAFIDLQAKQFIPMHWGTFHFGTEQFDEPIKLLKSWWQKQEERLKEKTLRICRFGKAEKLLLFFFARFLV